MKLDWYQKRKVASIIGISYKCLVYFEYGATALSAIYYYKNSFNVTNPRFYYSFSLCAMYVSAVFSNLLCARLMDKTRNLRTIVLTLGLLNIIGNLTYTLTLSPLVPVVGRFLCGFTTGISTVMAGNHFIGLS